MATNKSADANDKVASYEKLVSTIPDIELKGDKNPYTSVNGNMFSMLSAQDRMALRLPEDKREEFLKKYKTTLFEAHGTVLKEYVAVPDSLLKKTNELKKYFRSSYEYARSLKAKPTKKKPRG